MESNKNSLSLFCNAVIALCAVVSLILSIITYYKMSVILNRDDTTQLMLQGEQAFRSGNYTEALSYFSSGMLYDNPVAQTYIGYILASKNDIFEYQDVQVITKYFERALEAGYYPAIDNYLYMVLNYSTCFYEMADALLYAYSQSNETAIVFLQEIANVYNVVSNSDIVEKMNNALSEPNSDDSRKLLAVVLKEYLFEYQLKCEDHSHNLDVLFLQCKSHDLCYNAFDVNQKYSMSAGVYTLENLNGKSIEITGIIIERPIFRNNYILDLIPPSDFIKSNGT